MTNGEASRTRKPLPIWPILREACLLPWNRRQHFGRLLIIPVALATLLSLSTTYWLAEEDDTWRTEIFSFLLMLPHFLIFTFFAVSCHRSVLLGDLSVGRFGVPGWSMRETRFFLWLLGIYTLGYFAGILSVAGLTMVYFTIIRWLGRTIEVTQSIMDHPAFFYTLMALMLVPFVYLVGRLSLVLPAVAVDLRPRVNPSWSLTYGNGWRVTVLVGGIPLLSSALQMLFGFAIDWLTEISRTSDGSIQWLGAYSMATSGLQTVLYYMLATLEVAILSLTFKKLSGWQPNMASPSPAS